LIGAYLAVGTIVLPLFRFQINADGISYISIARHYLSGHWNAAINAYWSPLLSWLLIPLLWRHIPALIAAKIESLIIGAFTLLGVRQLGRNLNLTDQTQTVLSLFLIPLILSFAFTGITPDLLAATVALYYLSHVTRPARPSPVACGLLGATAYLAKALFMWFFVAHVTIAMSLRWRRSGSSFRELIRELAIVSASFAVIAGPWVGCLAWKYQRITTGTAGAYNYALIGPQSPGHAMYTDGFFPPPNAYATSVWEDPTSLARPNWNPFSTRAAFRHQVRVLAENARVTLQALDWYSPIWLGIAVVCLFLCGSDVDPEPNRPILLTLLAAAILVAGYELVLVQYRYLMLVPLLLLPLGASALQMLDWTRLGDFRRALALFVMCATFLIHPVRELIWRIHDGRSAFETAHKLRGFLPAESRIASDAQWDQTLFIAFDAEYHYYGQMKPGDSPADIIPALEHVGADYLLVWSDQNAAQISRENWIRIDQGEASGLAVFRVPH